MNIDTHVTAAKQQLADQDLVTVPLASDHYGPCKSNLIIRLLMATGRAAFVPPRKGLKGPVVCVRHCAEADLPSGRFPVSRRRFLPGHSLPHRLPLQAPEGQLHHPHLPPQYQFQRQHLFRHSARPVEPCSYHFQRYAEQRRTCCGCHAEET